MKISFINNIFLKIALRVNFGFLTSILKLIYTYFKYYFTTILFQNGNKKEIIFISGLPKSGTTWLENLLSVNNTYKNIMPYQVIKWEQKYGRSDNFIPSSDFFKKIPNGKWIIKLHSKFSDELNLLLIQHNIRPVIIYRDLNKIFDSHINYVINTKFHPDYNKIIELKVNDRFEWVKKKYEKDFINWKNGWSDKAENCYKISYESLLSDTYNNLNSIFSFLNISLSEREILKIIKNNTIQKLKSKSAHKSFFRGSDLKN